MGPRQLLALFGPPGMSAFLPLLEEEQTSPKWAKIVANDPTTTCGQHLMLQ
jgi:hypothetical protein